MLFENVLYDTRVLSTFRREKIGHTVYISRRRYCNLLGAHIKSDPLSLIFSVLVKYSSGELRSFRKTPKEEGEGGGEGREKQPRRKHSITLNRNSKSPRIFFRREPPLAGDKSSETQLLLGKNTPRSVRKYHPVCGLIAIFTDKKLLGRSLPVSQPIAIKLRQRSWNTDSPRELSLISLRD